MGMLFPPLLYILSLILTHCHCVVDVNIFLYMQLIENLGSCAIPLIAVLIFT